MVITKYEDHKNDLNNMTVSKEDFLMEQPSVLQGKNASLEFKSSLSSEIGSGKINSGLYADESLIGQDITEEKLANTPSGRLTINREASNMKSNQELPLDDYLDPLFEKMMLKMKVNTIGTAVVSPPLPPRARTASLITPDSDDLSPTPTAKDWESSKKFAEQRSPLWKAPPKLILLTTLETENNTSTQPTSAEREKIFESVHADTECITEDDDMVTENVQEIESVVADTKCIIEDKEELRVFLSRSKLVADEQSIRDSQSVYFELGSDYTIEKGRRSEAEKDNELPPLP